MVYFLVALLILGFDQLSKWWVVHSMSLYESFPLIEGFFHITSHRNRGAAFGILQNQQWLFISISILVTIALIYYLFTMKDEPMIVKLSLSLILGGAVGNLLDRLRYGEVVDFFHFQFGTYHFPIFNIADAAIVVGVIVLLGSQFLENAQVEERKDVHE